ncbi:hypothetical protein NSE01_35880 [Novosphingobium sediminis]|uniref:Uncharacterized protein n=1 Tax=Novosphingobium sediminis TaxID=707214 RepID=A0A512APX0_9SPHN|nr:hypothetical protein [Novosphingobium sediminis]GEO01756.1 hypothetical protein NSE01_35880 [Novosphingobium sediminis]
MTAPAPILFPRADVRPSSRDAAPAAANNGVKQDKAPGFAGYLAQETPPADEPAQLAVTEPADRSAAPEAPADAAPVPEEPGKVLPAIRHSLAAPAAALRLLIGAEVQPGRTKAAEGSGDQTDADKAAEPADAAVLLPITPAVALGPLPAANAQEMKSADATQTAAGASPITPQSAEAAPAVASQGTQNAAHPAAFAVANLVLETDTPNAANAAPPSDASPAPQASPAATQVAAQAHPSTLEALTGAAKRTGTRKLLAETEAPLPSAKQAAAPDTAAALALAQTYSAPAIAGSPDTPAASGPQPLSFDQLVDSIARARDGVDQGGPVAVALRHGEFGRISLRIESDAAGLSVAMASSDPAFAPAVAAAHAAAIGEPMRPSTADTRAGSSGPGPQQGQGQSASQSGSGQQRQPSAGQRPATNPARSTALGGERRGGIFA